MDEAYPSSDEIRDLVFLLLDAIDIIEGDMIARDTWTAQAWDTALMLVERLHRDE